MEHLDFADFSINNRNYYIADLLLQKNQYNDIHTHNFYEFIIVLKGEFSQKINGSTVQLPKGTVYFCKPTDVHSLSTQNQYNTNILRNIAIQKDYFEQCLESLSITDTSALYSVTTLDDTTFNMYKTKTDILLEFSQNETTNEYILQSIISDLFITVMLQHHQKNSIPNWLKRLYDEMAKEENYVIGLPRMVELSDKSQEHMSRAFKHHYGITPSTHINNIRLKNASLLLQNSDDKILDIVYKCGFDNVSYFNRLFKIKYSLSPREYREVNKNFQKISL